MYVCVGYSTTKVKDRGIVENAPQLIVKGVGLVLFYIFMNYEL